MNNLVEIFDYSAEWTNKKSHSFADIIDGIVLKLERGSNETDL